MVKSMTNGQVYSLCHNLLELWTIDNKIFELVFFKSETNKQRFPHLIIIIFYLNPFNAQRMVSIP